MHCHRNSQRSDLVAGYANAENTGHRHARSRRQRSVQLNSRQQLFVPRVLEVSQRQLDRRTGVADSVREPIAEVPIARSQEHDNDYDDRQKAERTRNPKEHDIVLCVRDVDAP